MSARSSITLALVCSAALACGPKPASKGPAGETKSSRQAILDSSDLPQTMAEPLADDPMKVTVHRLDNGLTVYISPNPQEPRVSAWIAVRAGSRHDPADSTGLAHYLEHMLFKGSSRLGTLDAAAERTHIDRIAGLYAELRSATDEQSRTRIMTDIDQATQETAGFAIPNELDQLYARLGITGVNAFTDNEETVYIADVPSNRFEQFIEVEADRFQSPVFRLFFPELESVYEEKNISMDRPIFRILETLYAKLFPEHPYGTQPTIGHLEHLKTPAYADMEAYFQRWYVPNNVAIVLAGDIDASRALPVIEKHFGAWQPKQLEPPAPGKVEPVAGRKVETLTAPGEAAVYMGWVTAPVAHEDAPALEVLDLLMDNAATGLINTELVLSQKLPGAGSFIQFEREAGIWAMFGMAREGQSLDEVEGLLVGVLDKLRAGSFTQADLDAIVLHQEMREMRESESNRTRVGKITEAYIDRIPWPEAAHHRERLRAVTKEQVVAVAKRYLGPDQVVVIRRQKGDYTPPKVSKPSITPVSIDPSRKSAFARSIEERPGASIEPEWLVAGTHYQERSLATGPLIAVENKRNRLFSVTYEYQLGTRTLPLVCLAVDVMEQSGLGGLSPEALQRKLYAMGTTLSTRCEMERVAFTLEGIDENFDESVALLGRWLEQANLEEETLRKYVENDVSARKDAIEKPEFIDRALRSFAARGEASEFLNEPSNKALQEATRAQLAGLLKKLARTKHRTRYFGPRAADQAASSVALGTGAEPMGERPPQRYRTLKGSRVFFVHKEMAQARVSFFMPEPPMATDQRPRARLYSEYVGGGMGALIFQEMREARGLAYSAWAGFLAGDKVGDQAALMGIVGTQADKSREAITTMLQLLREPPMDPARVTTAKSAIEAEYRTQRIDPRDIPETVSGWRDLGLTEDPRPGYWRTVEAMGPDDLAAFAKRFAGPPVIIGVLGDRARVDMKALGLIAPVEEIQVGQLFSY